MPFKKGQSGNPLGKPKGTKNTATKSVKRMLSIIKRNIVLVEKDIQNATPQERMDILIKVAGVFSGNQFNYGPKPISNSAAVNNQQS